MALLLEAGLLVPAEGHAVVLARLEIDFSSEMTWPADVSIENAFHRIGNKSLHVRQRLLVGGAVTSRSSSVLAVIDTTTRRAVPLQNAWRVVFERWLVPDFS